MCMCHDVIIHEISKYKKAQQHKTKIIDEDGLFKMLRDSNPSGGASSKASPGVPSTPAKSNKVYPGYSKNKMDKMRR